MCGRYRTPDEKEIRPGDSALVYTAMGAEEMHWGIPLANKKLIINARCETAADKPLFRQAMKEGRAVIEASAFFEWDEHKRCHSFTAMQQQKIYLAALCTLAQDGQKRFTILTQPAQGEAQKVHPRMPCFLPSEEYRHLWLHSEELAKDLLCETQPLCIERVMRGIEQTSLFTE